MSLDDDCADLTKVGPGTVMGEFMRQYWIPCMLSSEVVTDGPPIRLPILGEKLVAFRDSNGRIGVMDHRCPHRCASLFLGRNEEGGLRCVYHGWKFDVAGNCVDIPSISDGDKVKHRVHAKAYPAEERNGLIWIYMGSRETPPPLPQFEANLLDVEQVECFMVYRDCNWLQSAEGDIDTAHFGFLHAGTLKADELGEDHPYYPTVLIKQPKYEVSDMPWGTSYGAYRSLPNGDTSWRTANFMFPFWTQTPAGDFSTYVHARAWIPIDDERTMSLSISWRGGTTRDTIDKLNLGPGYRLDNNYLPNTTDWYGRWRLAENESNDWKIDREAQMSGQSFTGIDNVHLQDQAVTESMGPITNHSWEHLMASDRMIGQTRRRVLRAAREFASSGTPPPGVDDPEVFMDARAGFFSSKPGLRWEEVYQDNLARAVRPADGRASADKN